MALSYHSHATLTQTALMQARKSRPDLAPLFERLETHIQEAPEDSAKRALHVHAFLLLLTSPDMEQASASFARLRRISKRSAVRVIRESLPFLSSFPLPEETLYKKGFIRIQGTYHPVIKGLESGSVFDQARRKCDEDGKRILDVALGFFVWPEFMQKHYGFRLNVERDLLSYMALHMIPKGAERDFLANRMSLAADSVRAHRVMLEKSSRDLHKIASEIGFDLTSRVFVTLRRGSSVTPLQPARTKRNWAVLPSHSMPNKRNEAGEKRLSHRLSPPPPLLSRTSTGPTPYAEFSSQKAH